MTVYIPLLPHTHSQFGLAKQTQKPKKSGDREESTEKKTNKQREDGCYCCYCCSTKTFKHNTQPKKNCNKKCETIHTQKTAKKKKEEAEEEEEEEEEEVDEEEEILELL
jgi:MarR-like DNA-binding transcriptional regulator SgrR of sgrS sRNA